MTAQLLEPTLFREQMNSPVEEFQLSSVNNLLHLLQLMRNITHMNRFVSDSYGSFDVKYSTVEKYAEELATFKGENYNPRAFKMTSGEY